MDESLTAKCSCQHCAVHLEFPLQSKGTEIACPSCGQSTILSAPETEPESAPEPALADIAYNAVQVNEIIAAFNGRVRSSSVSFLYTLGLGLVAGMMILLPFVYVALIGLVGWLSYLWATRFSWFLAGGLGGIHFYLLKLTLYVAPLFAGGVLVLFMIKPLFAKKVASAQPLALNARAEPVLFAFITQICRAVGAPFPMRIDIDCQLNASASFRRGMWSFFGSDLVLTIGLPLVAGCTMRQLAGVIAHEFGHFTQGAGMRLSYVIRTINGWFIRVIYQRDAWDATLDQWGESEDGRIALIVGLARLGVGCSRLLLGLLMRIGHAVSCFMLRQMEYDADSYEIRLIGSQVFEETTQRFRVLGHALGLAYKTMRTKWNINHALPDNFPHYLMTHTRQIPEHVATQICDTLGLARSGVFDSHPSDGDRIRRARQAAEPGIFHLDRPATELFSNFEAVSRQVSLLHYSDDLGIPLAMAAFHPVAEAAPEPAAHDPQLAPLPAPNSAPGQVRLRIPKPGS